MVFHKESTLESLLLAIFIAVGLTGGTLGLLSVFSAHAAPFQARTSVSGVWGLAPMPYTQTLAQTLVPTQSLYQLAPVSVLTMTLAITDAKPGDMVFFTSTVATVTTIVDTGAVAGGSDRAVGLNDVIGFIFSNGKWIEAFFSDNS